MMEEDGMKGLGIIEIIIVLLVLIILFSLWGEEIADALVFFLQKLGRRMGR